MTKKSSPKVRAIELARDAFQKDEVPVGAVICLNGEVIASAFNQRETDQDPLGHAEIIAMKRAAKAVGSWRLEGCELYVTLEPCLMCLAAAQSSRVRKIFYALTDPKGGALSLGYAPHEDTRMNHRFECELDTSEWSKESQELLQTFFKGKRTKRS